LSYFSLKEGFAIALIFLSFELQLVRLR